MPTPKLKISVWCAGQNASAADPHHSSVYSVVRALSTNSRIGRIEVFCNDPSQADWHQLHAEADAAVQVRAIPAESALYRVAKSAKLNECLNALEATFKSRCDRPIKSVAEHEDALKIKLARYRLSQLVNFSAIRKTLALAKRTTSSVARPLLKAGKRLAGATSRMLERTSEAKRAAQVEKLTRSSSVVVFLEAHGAVPLPVPTIIYSQGFPEITSESADSSMLEDVPQELSWATRIVLPSRSLADALEKRDESLCDKLRIVPLALGRTDKVARPVSAPPSIPQPFILANTTSYTTETNAKLIEAFSLLACQGNASLQLVIRGVGDVPQQLTRLIAQRGLKNRVHFHDAASDQTSWSEHSLAKVLTSPWDWDVQASVQALQNGCPIIAADAPYFHDTLEGLKPSVLYFKPSDHHELAQSLRVAIEDRDRVVEQQQARLPSLLERSWEDVATEWLHIIGDAICEHDRSKQETVARFPVLDTKRDRKVA